VVALDIADERSGKVVFVSHCLLNENVRYPGGAFSPGAVDSVVDLAREHGWGIVQMPCPEQRYWGGVRKSHLRRVYGAAETVAWRFRRPLTWLALRWYALRAARLARQVLRQVDDYHAAGFEVAGIVGVGPSPSCGVRTTLDVPCAVAVLGHCPVVGADRRGVNHDLLVGCRVAGEGAFLRQIRRGLEARGLPVPLWEHDLTAEMHDRTGRLLADEVGSGTR
jgi:predicted secreted protein